MFSVRSERQSVEVEPCSLLIQTFETVGDSKVDPNPHIIWLDLESSMVALDSFIRTAEMRQGCSHLVPKGVVSWIKLECSIEETDGDFVVSLNEVEHSKGGLNRWQQIP